MSGKPKARVFGFARPPAEVPAAWTAPPPPLRAAEGAPPAAAECAPALRGAAGARWLLAAAALQAAVALALAATAGRARAARLITLTADFRLWEPADKAAPCDARNPCAALAASREVAVVSPRAVAALAALALAGVDAAAARAGTTAAFRRWAPAGATLAACDALAALAGGATDVADVAMSGALVAAGAMLLRESEDAPPSRRARLACAGAGALALATAADCARAALAAGMSGDHYPGRARLAVAAQVASCAGVALLQAAWIARGGRPLAADPALRRALDLAARAAALVAVTR